jgi:sterol desaturase/sphingolipid hydroxylase (fatty acid hydroxylase superfamily)
MVFLPIFFYWSYSSILYIVSHLRWTSLELHRIPTHQKLRPQNKVTVSKLLWTVLFQHIVQAVVAVVLVLLTRPEEAKTGEWKMEEWYMVILKLWVASLILDTYQVCAMLCFNALLLCILYFHLCLAFLSFLLCPSFLSIGGTLNNCKSATEQSLTGVYNK